MSTTQFQQKTIGNRFGQPAAYEKYCAYLVPHVVEENSNFLKTIIPNRKATKAYMKEKEDQNNDKA